MEVVWRAGRFAHSSIRLHWRRFAYTPWIGSPIRLLLLHNITSLSLFHIVMYMSEQAFRRIQFFPVFSVWIEFFPVFGAYERLVTTVYFVNKDEMTVDNIIWARIVNASFHSKW